MLHKYQVICKRNNPNTLIINSYKSIFSALRRYVRARKDARNITVKFQFMNKGGE